MRVLLLRLEERTKINSTLLSKIYTRFNFHKHTFCVWREVSEEVLEALEISYTSSSGSRYVFLEEGVYRISNHWGRAANCRWRLEALAGYKNQVTRIGYAQWRDFYPNDEESKLFFITVDSFAAMVTFHHRDSGIHRGQSILRTAAATAKRIALINKVVTEDDWAKHLRFSSMNDLRREIVEELLTTDASFITIKHKHHQD